MTKGQFLYSSLAALAFGLGSVCPAIADDLNWFDWRADDLNYFETYRWRGDSITIENGNAVNANIAIQTIDPWPPHVHNSRINIDGERALIGITRYKANKSIKPESLETQDVNVVPLGGSSNSGGGDQ
jgi:hypothetical protein